MKEYGDDVDIRDPVLVRGKNGEVCMGIVREIWGVLAGVEICPDSTGFPNQEGKTLHIPLSRLRGITDPEKEISKFYRERKILGCIAQLIQIESEVSWVLSRESEKNGTLHIAEDNPPSQLFIVFGRYIYGDPFFRIPTLIRTEKPITPNNLEFALWVNCPEGLFDIPRETMEHPEVDRARLQGYHCIAVPEKVLPIIDWQIPTLCFPP